MYGSKALSVFWLVWHYWKIMSENATYTVPVIFFLWIVTAGVRMRVCVRACVGACILNLIWRFTLNWLWSNHLHYTVPFCFVMQALHSSDPYDLQWSTKFFVVWSVTLLDCSTHKQPCQVLGAIGSVLGLVGLVSAWLMRWQVCSATFVSLLHDI